MDYIKYIKIILLIYSEFLFYLIHLKTIYYLKIGFKLTTNINYIFKIQNLKKSFIKELNN